MRYLLDTCVLSEPLKRHPSKRVIEWLKGQDEAQLFLSVITLGELRKGICKLDPGDRRNELDRWIDQDLMDRFAGRVLPVDQEVAGQWGEMSAQAEALGKTLSVLDALIAATSIVFSMTLVTRNTHDMNATGARLLDPWCDLER